MKHLTAVAVAIIFMTALFFIFPAFGALDLPNYASGGNLKSELQSKGKAITDTVSMIAAIVSIIGIVVGGGMIGSGNADSGKRYVLGGIIGLIIAGVAFGIAQLVA